MVAKAIGRGSAARSRRRAQTAATFAARRPTSARALHRPSPSRAQALARAWTWDWRRV